MGYLNKLRRSILKTFARKVRNDGIFINNGDGTYSVFYSKPSFFKVGEVISYEVMRKALPLYKCAIVTDKI